jgi:hypothetical protein
MKTAPDIKFHRTLLNLVEGKLLLDWEAANRDTFERWLAAEGFDPPVWLMLMEYEVVDERLVTA